MTPADIAIRRIINQQISRNDFAAPEDVVRWMTAMQAQDYLSALWAIAMRVSGNMTEADIEQAIADRKIVRTWPMRGTIHFVAPEDVRWMQQLLTPRIIRSFAGRRRELGLDDSTLFKSRKLLEKALQENHQLTRTEMYGVLEKGNISTDGQRGYHILVHLAEKQVLCWGPRKGKTHTFVLLDEWVPESKMLSGDEALAELAARYIRSRGPATAYDFSSWSGLTVTDSKKAFEMIRGDFLQETLNGHDYRFPVTGPEPQHDSGQFWLLPAFDEMICGYKDRSAILPDAWLKSIILKNGIIRAVILKKEGIAGTWKRSLKTNSVTVETEIFDKINKSGQQELIAAFEKYAAFLGLQLEKDKIPGLSGTA